MGYFGGGKLTNATLQNNDGAGTNDLVSSRRPRLGGSSTCTGTSARFDQSSGTFGTWSVCAGD